MHADTTPPVTALLVERNDEVAPANENPAHGLAGRKEPNDALAEPAELPGAEQRLLDVEPNQLRLEVIGRAVPGAASSPRHARWGRRAP